MGIEHPYLAILALIAFIAGITSAIYLYIYIYTETIKTPVLSAYTGVCYNESNSVTYVAITIRHERGEPVSLQKLQITSDMGIIDIDNISNGFTLVRDIRIGMTLVNFNGRLFPGQLGKIKMNISQIIHSENKTYQVLLLFDKTTILNTFQITSCWNLISQPELPWQLIYTKPLSIRLAYPLEVDVSRIDQRGALYFTDFEQYPSDWKLLYYTYNNVLLTATRPVRLSNTIQFTSTTSGAIATSTGSISIRAGDIVSIVFNTSRGNLWIGSDGWMSASNLDVSAIYVNNNMISGPNTITGIQNIQVNLASIISLLTLTVTGSGWTQLTYNGRTLISGIHSETITIQNITVSSATPLNLNLGTSSTYLSALSAPPQLYIAYITSNGYKGRALALIDVDIGIVGGTQFYWHNSLSSYYNLWASVKTRLSTTSEARRGLVLLSDTYYYIIYIYNGYIIIYGGGERFYNGSSTILNYNRNMWYTLVINYNYRGPVPGRISFNIYVYNESGNHVATLSTGELTPRQSFLPKYIGVYVDNYGLALFDDFIVSRTDPRVILFNGLRRDIKIEVIDDLGYVVASDIASDSSLNLFIVHDIVVGRGIDGSIAIYNQTVYCGSKQLDSIVGGDMFMVTVKGDCRARSYIERLVIGINYTFAYIALNDMSNYVYRLLILCLKSNVYTRLRLIDYNNIFGIDIQISLIGQSESESKILIRDNKVYSSATSIVGIYGDGYISITGKADNNSFLYIILDIYSSINPDKIIANIPIFLEIKP